MSLSIRRFFVPAILFFVALSVVSGEARRAFAQAGPETIEVFPANIDPRPAAAGEDLDCSADRRAECTVQQLVDMAAPGDTVMFMPGSGENPNVYDDVGEILVTRDGEDAATITIRGGAGSRGDDMITFTGKVMFNVKASNIVIKRFRFKDTEIPDSVAMRATFDAALGEASRTVEYGLSGVTIADYLAETDARWDEGDDLTPANVLAKRGFARARPSGGYGSNNSFYWNDDLFVTVVSGADEGKILKIDGSGALEETAAGDKQLIGAALPVSSALNALGTIWVDSASTRACGSGGNLKNVQIRNNVFENTYLAGVKAGDHSAADRNYIRAEWSASQISGYQCSAQVEIVGNTFVDVGGNGPFAENSDGEILLDGAGNKVASDENREAAISLSRVGSSGSGDDEVPSRITDNVISGGTYDAISVLYPRLEEVGKVEISYNDIANSVLSGIDIVGRNGNVAADVTVEGNRIWGASDNRFLTKNFRGITGYLAGAGGNNWRAHLPGDGSNMIDVVIGCAGYDSGNDAASKNSIRRRIQPEVWKSDVPTFPFSDAGAPRSIIDDAGETLFAPPPASNPPPRTTLAYHDLIRYRADECYNLGRIRVVKVNGVRVVNNDLGHAPDPDIAGSPKNGVVVEGTGVSLEEFTGNNIDYYKDYAVLNAGDGFSAAGNYLGIRPLVSGDVEGAGESASEPLAGAGRTIGPRERYAMPDEEPPALVESGDGAPAVSGAVLTLAFNDALDATSVPAGGAFEVKSVVGDAVVYHVVESVAISGTTVTLTLVEAVARGAAITVSYDAAEAGDGMIRDDAGLALASFENKAVTNGTPAAPGTDTREPVDAQAPGGGGGCALASAGSGGTGFGALLLAMLPFAFFGVGGKKKNAV